MGYWGRLGEHLVEAGRPDEAMAPLLAAVAEAWNDGDARGAMGLVERAREAM
ncbi:MAG: tetratricopeptide repeat protein, partial [Fuerstiella sp.]|nr:tetratricopeptide repeat protein [Fuerstiella sp.]